MAEGSGFSRRLSNRVLDRYRRSHFLSSVSDLRLVAKDLNHLLLNQRFKLLRRNPPAAVILLPCLAQAVREIVAITNPLLAGVDWAHSVAGLVEHDASQKMDIGVVGLGPSPGCLCCKKGLHLIERLVLDDRLMFAVIELVAVPDLADVDGVGEQVIEIAASERLAGTP